MSKALLCRELNGLKVIAVSAKKRGRMRRICHNSLSRSLKTPDYNLNLHSMCIFSNGDRK